MSERDFGNFDELPSFGDFGFERLANKVWQLLPQAKVERTSEVIQLTTGDFRDESGLVILINPDAMELRLPVLTWIGPHKSAQTSRLWERYALDQLEEAQLADLIAQALVQQQESFSDCQYCGQHKPKGWMHGEDVCQSCAEKELGIVY